MSDKKQTAFRISEGLLIRLKAEAKKQNRSLNNLIEVLIDKHTPKLQIMTELNDVRFNELKQQNYEYRRYNKYHAKQLKEEVGTGLNREACYDLIKDAVYEALESVKSNIDLAPVSKPFIIEWDDLYKNVSGTQTILNCEDIPKAINDFIEENPDCEITSVK